MTISQGPRRLAPAIVVLLFLALTQTAGAQTTPAPVMQPPITIAGPSAAIQGLSGIAVSRDGSGGLVYLESVGGVNHVFVSALTGGSFGAPVEVDSALPGASSQPVIAAGDGGLLIVAFINGGQLFVVTRASSAAALSAPQDLYNGALNPSVAISIHSEGYLAFTTPDGSGYDVRDFYYYQGQWEIESGPLNLTPADNAGTVAGAPKVAAAGDSEAIVVWGENGHIYARRVWYNMISYEVEQADPQSMDGYNEDAAESPVIGVGDNSSYADVSFDETFANGSAAFSRVLVNRLVASTFQGPTVADGQPFTGGGATGAGISMMQYGNGFVTSEIEGSDQVWANILGENGAPGTAEDINSLPNSSPPDPTSAIAGDYSGLIAWQHDPGLLGSSEIRARFYSNSAFGPEMVASNPAMGATNAAEGLLAAGDHGGDVAIAFVQGSGSSTTIQVAQLVYPPGSFSVTSAPHYRTSATPELTWFAPRELWGPTTYTVAVDGVAVGTSSGTSFTPTTPLSQGPHTFVVTAENQHGLTSAAFPGHFFVDSIPPTGKFTLTGKDRVGATLHLRVRYTDVPAGVAPAGTSGVATVVVKWGDGTSNRIRVQTATHHYLRAGRYKLTITITDRAGNRTVLTRQLRIKKSK
jgi:PKD domain